MSHIFVSYVEEDSASVEVIVKALEGAGYATWYYERDSLPGSNYLLQTGEAIESSQAFILLISPESVVSHQVSVEVVRAHECRKPIIPILRGLTHGDFQKKQPEWRQAIGAAASIRIPPVGVESILPRLLSGLQLLKLSKVSSVGGAESASAIVEELPTAALVAAPASQPPAVAPQASCPACGSPLLYGAVSCMDCGFLLESDTGEPAVLGETLLCPNFACGVANPPGTMYCARCNTLLQVKLPDRYKPEKFLRMGSRGPVDLARDQKTQRQVLVQSLICEDEAEFNTRVTSLQLEAEILTKLRGNALTPEAIELVQQPRSAHLIVEYFPGPTLLEAREKKHLKKFPVELLLDWTRKLCDVLISMHGFDPPWLLLNLTPEAIILAPDDRTIHLVGFGSACDTVRYAAGRRLRQTGKTAVHTDGYSPPEQLVRKPEPRSDLFSLAATLYELATGKVSEGVHSGRELEDELASAECAIPASDRWFYQMIAINLSEDVPDRYYSARELKADLEKRQVTKSRGSFLPGGVEPVRCLNSKCRKSNPPGQRKCVRCTGPLPYPPGSVLHRRYKVKRLLSVDPGCVRYLVDDEQMSKRRVEYPSVVLKEILCADPAELPARAFYLQQEAEAHRSCSHSALLPWCERNLSEGATLQLLVEHVPGRNVADVLESSEGRPIKLDLVLDWAKSLCDVLHLVHTQDPPWVLANLSPANLVVAQGTRNVRLLDLALAHRMTAKPEFPLPRVFKEPYAPPEQLEGKPLDARSDLYSLAATLYHLSTGKTPAGNDSVRELDRMLKDASMPAGQCWFFQLLRANLAENASDRYGSAREFKADLDAATFSRGSTASALAPVPCPNPACAAANPPSQRTCRRCKWPLPLPAGDKIHDRFRIERLIAVGGFSFVYLTTHLPSGRVMVVKDMFCPDAKELPLRLNFFRREAEILRMLAKTPQAPRLYGYVEKGTAVQLVLEYLPGQNLAEILKAGNSKPLPLDLVIKCGTTACEVLKLLHRHDPPMVYRDMKPDQLIFLDGDKALRMLDYGSVREIGKTLKERRAVKTKTYTEGYSPPEQILGRPVPRSDLFALAATLYHLATGIMPEGVDTGHAIAENLAAKPCPYPAEDRWFYELLRINLSEDVHERYLSASRFKNDLEKRRLSGTVRCPKCQAANRFSDAYCVQCQRPLTAPLPPCDKCGTINHAGVRTCRQCHGELFY